MDELPKGVFIVQSVLIHDDYNELILSSILLGLSG